MDAIRMIPGNIRRIIFAWLMPYEIRQQNKFQKRRRKKIGRQIKQVTIHLARVHAAI